MMKRTKSLLCALLLLCVFFAASAAFAAQYPKMTIRAAASSPIGSIHATTIEKFREVIERESGGAIKFQTFYGGSLGDEQANVKQLRTEEVHVTVVACGNVTPFAPRAALFIMPYMFPSMDDARKLFGDKAFMDKQNDVIAQQSGARPLGWAVGGYRVLTNSKRPVRTLADLQGLKLRVPPVAIQLDTFRAWGVEPHPLAWSETFNGLQQGVVDGQENPHSVHRDHKFWEVQKYISELHYMLWVGPLLVSEKWYRKLTPDTRALVDKAAAEAIRAEWAWSAKDEENALKASLEHGMVVNKLEDEDVWMQKARSVWPKYAEQVGGQAVLDEAVAVMKK